MASIDKRPNARYRARWREYPGGPQKTRQFARKGDDFLDGIRGDLARGLYVDPAGGRTLFRDYAEQWRAAQVHRASTATQAESYLRLHAYPTLATERSARFDGARSRPGSRSAAAVISLAPEDYRRGFSHVPASGR